MPRIRVKVSEWQWRVAAFEVGRPPIVLETRFATRVAAWLGALPYRLRDAVRPGITWKPVRVPGYSTVRRDDFARWHHTPADL